MAKLYYDQDADLALLADKKMAMLGYGSQGVRRHKTSRIMV